METLVDHLNDVKFEDFGRRFKKEVFENDRESKFEWKIDELCELKDQCPQARCPFLHNKKSCTGFKTCRNENCGKRHHPCRAALINNFKPAGLRQDFIHYPQQPLHPTFPNLQIEYQPNYYPQNGY